MMTLNMASQLEEYHCGPYQQLSRQQQLQPQTQGKESIHSGQFMVSHFEADAEAQDEDDNDSEIKMPDPDDPSLEKVEDVNLCTDVQLYVPQKVTETGSTVIVTSHLEIETSFTKLFKCMNLAYSQKLTSPKWNHFKGVRLRWKDKIRLNNVIWRCWHMQFILKKRTPVCQFASPLDVDIHSNPQTVVLEGKYWKRQLSVIKAEYRKWRRHFKTKAIGSLHCDSKSEFDFLEWSPLANERSFTLGEDWTTDTLFSVINGPFPFPDPREIARGAGIADFIQPSLGPLQPNLDELDVTFQELLESTRLAPVPEEGAEDLLKSVEYNFPAIMGSEQMDSTSIIDVTNRTQTGGISESIEDANMLELNTPLGPMSFTDKLYDQNVEMQPSPPLIASSQESSHLNILRNAQFADQIMNESQSTNLMEQNKPNVITIDNFTISHSGHLNSIDNSGQMPNSMGKNILKGRISKTTTRPFRKREPHNYDKAQPTLHQTTIYQQMLAEQQQQQQQQQQQLHQQNVQTMQFSQQYQNSNIGGNMFCAQPKNILNMPINQQQTVKSYSIPQTLPSMSSLNNSKFASSQSEILSLLNMNTLSTQDSSNSTTSLSSHQGNQQSSYKPYPCPQIMKKAASAASYISMSSKNIRQASPPGNQQQGTFIPDKHTSQVISQKEMFRSNSLPLNSSLQKIEPKEDNFVIPTKYNLKGNRSRTRSNSVQQLVASTTHLPFKLQSATSEPMLNSTLAQLLTTNSNKLQTKHGSSTTNISSNAHSLPPSGFSPAGCSSSNNFQSSTQNLSQNASCPSMSPIKSISIPMMLHSPPGNKLLSFPPSQSTPVVNLSPDPFTDQESPLSPTRSTAGSKYPKDSQRRVGHIHAEQKRRCNIKNGFDMLHSLIPQLQQNPNAKLSKAAMLQKGAEYIKQLRTDRKSVNEKMEALRKERDNLNNSLSHLHSILPANGAPVSRQRTERVKQLYNQYVRYRTMENWKFWILGLILEPLLNSYTTTVSMASIEELYRTALLWVEQHCSLIELRPAVSNKLRYLSMTTDILSDPPSALQEEVLKALNNPSGVHPNLSGS